VRGPGYFRGVWTVAAKDLRIEWRTLENLSAMALFSLIVIVVFNFAFELSTVRELGADRLVPGVLWTTLTFSGIVGFTRSFHLETRRESLTALLLSPVDRGALLLGKVLSNLFQLLVLELLIVPLSAVLFDFDLAGAAGPLALVLLVHTAGISVIGTLLGAVATRVGRGEALLATLLFPVATPLFISAVKCTAAVLGSGGLPAVSRWMWISVGFDMLYLFTGLLVFQFVVEE
jgi:heme exporter protein B